jgi:hypothetical protein
MAAESRARATAVLGVTIVSPPTRQTVTGPRLSILPHRLSLPCRSILPRRLGPPRRLGLLALPHRLGLLALPHRLGLLTCRTGVGWT